MTRSKPEPGHGARWTGTAARALALLLPVLALLPATSRGQAADRLGHGVLEVEGEPARGTRPALVVLMEFRDQSFDADHTADFYRQVFRGTSFPNLPEYFREQSLGAFGFSPWVVGPFEHPDDPGTRADESLINCALRRTTGGGCPAYPDTTAGFYDRPWERIFTTAIEVAAEEGGVDFADHDRDGDGRVTPDELVVLLIGAEPPGGRFREAGANRRAFPRPCVRVPGQDVRVCTSSTEGVNGAASFGEATDFDTFAHEMAHTLGALDLYGATSRMNGGVSLMAPTIGGSEDERATYHLDPWHKIALGWVRPRTRSLPEVDAGDACQVLRGVRGDASRSGRYGPPLLLHDPTRRLPRGRREFYLLEARSGEGYDRDVASGGGVSAWYVQVGPDGMPRRIDSWVGPGADGRLDTRVDSADVRRGNTIRPGPDGLLDSSPSDSDQVADDVLNFSVGAGSTGAPTAWSARGTSRPWRSSDGIADLPWFGGSRPAVSFRVVGSGAAGLRRFTVDLAPRTLRITPTRDPRRVRAGGTLVLSGHFGARGSREVRIRRAGGGGSPDTLPVESWRCHEIRVRVSAVSRGSHRVVVRDPDLGITSNSVEIDVGPRRADPSEWEGTWRGRLDGRRAELRVRIGSGDIPSYSIRLEDLDRGGVFTGSAPVSEGSGWARLRDLVLEDREGRTRNLGALYLHDGDDHTGVTGWSEWRGDDFGFAFGEPVASAPGGGERLDRSSEEAWARQWEGSYEGSLDGVAVELTLGTRDVTGLGATYDVALHFPHAGVTYRGEGSVLAGTPHQMRLGRPLSSGGPTLRVVRLLLHTWDTDFLSVFGVEGDGDPLAGHFARQRSRRPRPEPPRPDERVPLPRGGGEADGGVCRGAVQGEIAWNYTGDRSWAAGNVRRLCDGAEDSTAPARCFRRVMHSGEVDWGGGTRWSWRNALALCAGTRDAGGTIACFEDRISDGRHWREAIQACAAR